MVDEVAPVDRRKFLGGSDIAALFGIAPKTWKRNSPTSLYFDKVEPPKEEEQTNKREKKRGHRWEAVVAEMLLEQLCEPEFSLDGKAHKVEIVGRNKRYVDPDVPFFACEIDLELVIDEADEITNVELKTVHPFKVSEWGEEGTDASPIWYLSQAQWQLGCTRRRKAIIAPLFGADDIKVYPMNADQSVITTLRTEGHRFWTQHVIQRVPPPPTSLVDLATLYPKDAGGVIELKDNQRFVDAIAKLRTLADDWKRLETEYEALEIFCKEQMGTAAIALIGGHEACTWKTQSDARIDVKLLREKYPDIADRFTDKERTKRVFLLKKPKKGKK